MYAHLVRAPNVFAEIDTLRRQVDATFGGLWSGRGFDGRHGLFERRAPLAPRIEVTRTDAGWTLAGDLPGWRSEELSVRFDGGVLVLSGERKVTEEGWQVVRAERGATRFERSWRFAEPVDAAGISAELKDGVLRVSVPAAPRPQPVQVEVRS